MEGRSGQTAADVVAARLCSRAALRGHVSLRVVTLALSRLVSVLLLSLLPGTPAAAADIRIVIADGMVSMTATDATLREILTAWERVGQVRFENRDRLDDARTSIELVNVPEAMALDTLLRPLGGYLAVPRPSRSAHTSIYARVVLVPTSNAARSARVSASIDPETTPPDPSPVGPTPVETTQQPVVGQRRPGRPARPENGLMPVSVRDAAGTDAGATIGARAGASQSVATPRADTAVQPTAALATGAAAPGMAVPIPQEPGRPGVRAPDHR